MKLFWSFLIVFFEKIFSKIRKNFFRFWKLKRQTHKKTIQNDNEINNMESEMRILARKTKDILSRYRALQVKFRDLEREKDVTIETERKARKKAENELIEMKKIREGT